MVKQDDDNEDVFWIVAGHSWEMWILNCQFTSNWLVQWFDFDFNYAKLLQTTLISNALKVIKDIIRGWNLDNLQIRFNYTAHVLPFITLIVLCWDLLADSPVRVFTARSNGMQKPRLKHQTNITWCGESISPILPACCKPRVISWNHYCNESTQWFFFVLKYDDGQRIAPGTNHSYVCRYLF